MFYVYKIENILNGKFYVGRTGFLDRRFKDHRRKLNNNKHHCRYLQNSWNKYGEENFIFELMDEFETVEESAEVEQYYLDVFYNTRLYNRSRSSKGGGDNISQNPNREAIVKNISDSLFKRYSDMSKSERLELSLSKIMVKHILLNPERK